MASDRPANLPANYATQLPRNWQKDELFAEQLWRTVQRLYDESLSDQQIAWRTGISATGIFRWRKARQLPPNTHGGRPMVGETR